MTYIIFILGALSSVCAIASALTLGYASAVVSGDVRNKHKVEYIRSVRIAFIAMMIAFIVSMLFFASLA